MQVRAHEGFQGTHVLPLKFPCPRCLGPYAFFIPSASFTASARPTEHEERRTCIAVKLQGSLPLRDQATPATLAVEDTVATIWPSIAIAQATEGFIVLSHQGFQVGKVLVRDT